MHISNHRNDSRYGDRITTDVLTELSQDNYIFHQRKRTGEEADGDVVETHRSSSQLRSACSIRFNCQIRGQSRSYLAANLVLTMKSLYQRITELTWEIFGSSGAQLTLKLLWLSGVALSWKMKDSLVALLLQHEHQISSLQIEIYSLVSIPTACSKNQFPTRWSTQPSRFVPIAWASNQFPSGRNIQPGVYSYCMFNKSVSFPSKYTAQ